ncbi:MAG: epoxide hydrolase [Pseudonocardiales bacterium]|nr:epoxide hydrolase [Pseudonocardiales bacterium]
MSLSIDGFTIAVPEETLTDLRARLANTRWPAEATVPGWQQGVPVSYLQEFCRYWREEYDWRRTEARLNAVPQFTAMIDGLRLHFLHARSPHPDALPLVLTHGWPGSVREFLDLVEPLVCPADPADAFHVVCPSLPGFGFSDKPTAPGWGVQRIAAAIIELMSRLGYRRYAAQGGDWGAVITSIIGAADPAHVAGVHLNIPVVLSTVPDPELTKDLSDFEQQGVDRATRFGAVGTGYLTQMATKPQTLAYGLSDSPVAQAAWILEKFYEWTDCEGDPRNALSIDTMIDNIMLYWVTDSGASSSRIYWESMFDLPNDQVGVPAGCSIFPFEHVRVPRKVAERYLTDIVHWNELPRGGHFASLEQPDVFLDELRTCFAHIR